MRTSTYPVLLSLFVSLSLTAVGCGAPDGVVDDPAGFAGGKADGWGPGPVVTTTLRDPLLSRSFLDRAVTQVITTGSDYRRLTGHDLPGVNWAAYEWVVLYAPGRSGNLWTRVGLEVRGTADRTRFTVVRKLNRPGHACVTPDFPEAAGPYALVKFTASRNARIGYITWRDDSTLIPCQGPISWGCANSGCSGGYLCRLVDGVGRCVSPPASCDYVLCGAGRECGYGGDRAACFRIPGTEGEVTIPDNRPPFSLDPPGPAGPLCVTLVGDPPCDGSDVISFPVNPPINLACGLVRCNPGQKCSLTTGQCVTPTKGGGPGPLN